MKSDEDWNPFAAPASDLAPESFADTQHAQGPLVYAGFWDRVVAAFLDTVITYVACGFLMMVGFTAVMVFADRGESDVGAVVFFLTNLFWFVMVWLYHALQESSNARATVGKRLMRLRVVDLSGERLSFGRASGRYFAKIPSALLLVGYLIQPFTARKQALHDILAGTIVVHR